MKVLLVNKYFRRGAGAESVFFETLELLEQQGHVVAPFATQGEDNEDSPWSGYFARSRDYHADSVVDRTRDGLASIYSFSARRGLRGLLRQFRPDVAHLHNVYHQLTLSIVDELRAARIPTVMTVHDYKPVCPNYKLLTGGALCTRCVAGPLRNAVVHRCVKDSYAASAMAALEAYLARRRRTYNKIDRLIAPSHFLADMLVAGGFPPGRIDVIPNPVARGSNMDPSLVDDPPLFVYFGRLAPEKGLETLLAAVKAVRASVRISIYGDGPQRNVLERMSMQDHLPVTFHGLVSREEVARALRGARAAILPSIWFENCPMSVIEAAALGVPTIASDLGGIPELIEDRRSGMLVPPCDSRALAECIEELAMNARLATALGAAALSASISRHGSHGYITAVLDSYARAGAQRLATSKARHVA